MKLVIFDLDQTLVDFLWVHDEATRRVFESYFGVEATLTEIDFAGRSLSENLLELARLKHIPDEKIKDKSTELLESYDRFFGENIPRNASEHVLAGARELLEDLSKTDNLVVLYTGDSPSVARQILAATGLGKYFKLSMYGTESSSRVGMVRLALEKAERLAGKRFEKKEIVIIGDSVRDIDCGKEFDALTIAVATGFHSEEELSKRQPDYLFRSLEDHKRILKAIGR